MAERKSGQQDTRGAMVDAALALFAERGFEATSVDAIVAKARLSKGTFFHYFRTKEAILDAACERLAAEGWGAVKDALAGSGDPTRRLASYLAEGRRFRVAHAARVGDLWEALEQQPNAKLKAKVHQRHRELVGPAMVQVVSAGVEQGQFQVEDAEATTELLLEFLEASAEGTMRLLRAAAPGAAELACRRVNATLTAVERILGMAGGSLERIDGKTVQAFQKQPAPGTGG